MKLKPLSLVMPSLMLVAGRDLPTLPRMAQGPLPRRAPFALALRR